MLYNEKQDVRVRRWNWLLLFCLSLALVVSANGTALDKRIPKRGSRQELPFEKRLEAEQRLFPVSLKMLDHKSVVSTS
jgi:hypothetical protein